MWYGDKKCTWTYIYRPPGTAVPASDDQSGISDIQGKKLMADIYKSGEFNNRNNSVNKAIYRLRKMLTDAGVPGDEYIAIENGNCVWKKIYLFR